MEPYTQEAARTYPLNHSDDWLLKHQGLALPVLPPSTLEARKYFFCQIRRYAEEPSINGHQKVDFESFVREWNERFM